MGQPLPEANQHLSHRDYCLIERLVLATIDVAEFARQK